MGGIKTMTEHNDDVHRIAEQLQNIGSKDVTITVTPDLDTTIDLIGKIVDIRDGQKYCENSQAIYNEGAEATAFSIFKDVSKYISSSCSSDELKKINKLRGKWGLSWDKFVKKIVFMWVHEKEFTELREKDLSELIELRRDLTRLYTEYQ